MNKTNKDEKFAYYNKWINYTNHYVNFDIYDPKREKTMWLDIKDDVTSIWIKYYTHIINVFSTDLIINNQGVMDATKINRSNFYDPLKRSIDDHIKKLGC